MKAPRGAIGEVQFEGIPVFNQLDTSLRPVRFTPPKMDALAIVVDRPEHLALSRLDLTPPTPEDVVVQTEWSGISTGTERLLWKGLMPPFPGMGYPLVPGYETVGRVVSAPSESGLRVGDRVFVPGARCFGSVRGLFGGAASRLVVPASRVIPIDGCIEEEGILLALAATAQHSLAGGGGALPELIVGHGVLGRLLARLVLVAGGRPVVWEKLPQRREGDFGYAVLDPEADPRRDYVGIVDVSGDASLLDRLVERLAPRAEIVLAGFYRDRPSFDFAPAFMREARFRIAAEWQRPDLEYVHQLVAKGRLSLDGLITHRREVRPSVDDTAGAYRTAFEDPSCLKMMLDWRACS